MKKLVLLLLFSNFLLAQDNYRPSTTQYQEIRCKNKHRVSNEALHYKSENHLFIEAGINYSNFQGISSDLGQGYSFGLTYSLNFTEKIGLDLTGLISRQITYIRDNQAMIILNDIGYLRYYDWKVSFLFFEFPIMAKYNLWKNKTSFLQIVLGPGFSLAHKDNTKWVNIRITDKIIAIDPFPPTDTYVEKSFIENSGINFNFGACFKYRMFIIKLLYTNKLYVLQNFDRLHTVAFHLGYKLK